jgi:phosphatidylglycerol:prolipoprotein diacylglycerol transferase
MYRELFGIQSYLIVQVAALFLFATLAVILLRRNSIPMRHAAALTVLYVLCNFLAAKLLYDFVKTGGQDTLFDDPTFNHFLKGGFWGWPIAFLPLVFAYPFVLRLPRVPFLRTVAFLLPPVFAVQKIACFLAGCCFGTATLLPWAVVFPEDSRCETPGAPVHPLQLYDTALPLVILLVLHVVDSRGGEPAGPFLFPLMVGLYALSRFATEFLRPHPSGEVLLLSQWLELGVVMAVALLLTLGRSMWLGLVQAKPRPAASVAA